MSLNTAKSSQQQKRYQRQFFKKNSNFLLIFIFEYATKIANFLLENRNSVVPLDS